MVLNPLTRREISSHGRTIRYEAVKARLEHRKPRVCSKPCNGRKACGWSREGIPRYCAKGGFKLSSGSKYQVYHGIARQTCGRVKKSGLLMDKHGVIRFASRSRAARSNPALLHQQQLMRNGMIKPHSRRSGGGKRRSRKTYALPAGAAPRRSERLAALSSRPAWRP